MKCRVFVDFDGTIAPVDTTDLLLERFAAPAGRRSRTSGRPAASARANAWCARSIWCAPRPPRWTLHRHGTDIDPGFPAFVRLFRRLGHDAHRSCRTVSTAPSARCSIATDIDLPYFANHLEWRGDDRWRLTFPHARSDCAALSGNCKCSSPEGSRASCTIVVGDGRSDFCVAGRADLVLAKGSLLSTAERAICRTSRSRLR